MNQPKFNFGDFVQRKDSGHRFVVNGISRWTSIELGERIETFAYNTAWNELPALEKDLEIYQEPQKKKLYAFCNTERNNSLEFYPSETGIHVNGPLKRAPEYDIEYIDPKPPHLVGE